MDKTVRDETPTRVPIAPISNGVLRPEQELKLANYYGQFLKYSLVLLVTAIAIYFLVDKVSQMKWAEFSANWRSIPRRNILIALGLTATNFCLMTGYDLIAIRYLKKDLPIHKAMAGAVIGYAMSNILGWLLGGTAVRYRLYRRWGFSQIEIIAFVSILSITFWLGMFLLAGVAFTMLPVKLPTKAESLLIFTHQTWGYIFLAIVCLYLLASVVIRKPIRLREYQYGLPPAKLSLLQLIVSAGDFLITSSVLYLLLPPHVTGPEDLNFSTVLVTYLTAMIMVVMTHVPSGVGVLETGILLMAPHQPEAALIAGIVMFRIVYYLVPAAIATLWWGALETYWLACDRKKPSQQASMRLVKADDSTESAA